MNEYAKALIRKALAKAGEYVDLGILHTAQYVAQLGTTMAGGEDFGLKDPHVNPDSGRFEVGVIRGYRCWGLHETDDGIELRALTYFHEKWTEGVNVSRHLKGTGDKSEVDNHCKFPTLKCMHGFYAYYNTRYWMSDGYARPTEPDIYAANELATSTEHLPAKAGGSAINAIRIYGVIDAFGHLVRGSKGFRAEKAVITGLTLPFIRGASYVGGELESALIERLEASYPNIPVFKTPDKMFDVLPLRDYDLDIDF